MKKPYSVGIKGCNIASKQVVGLLIFLFVSFTAFAQIPINGFCRITELNLPGSYTKVLPLSFNNDAFTDLLFYNPENAKVVTFRADENMVFKEMYRGTLPLKVNQTVFPNRQNTNDITFIASRSRKIGSIFVSNSGNPTVVRSKQLDNFPGEITHFTTPKSSEGITLLCGAGHNGIQYFNGSSQTMKLQSVVQSGIFTALATGDFNMDSYPDVCGYDIKNNSLSFFYNNSQDRFRFSKLHAVQGNLTDLVSVDINADANPEVIYSNENGIIILVGDSVHSYNTQKQISTEFPVKSFTFGDFNRDGKIDFAYAMEQASGVYLAFQKSDFTFYPAMQLLANDTIQYLSPYYSKFIDGLIALNRNNIAFFIHHVTSFAENTNIAVSGKNCLPIVTDIGSDGLEDFVFFDNTAKSLKSYIRNRTGIPALYLETPLFDDADNVMVLDKSKVEKVYFAVASNSGKIHQIQINYRTLKHIRSEYQVKGALLGTASITVTKKKLLAFVTHYQNNLELHTFSAEGFDGTVSIADIPKTEFVLDLMIQKNGDVLYVTRNLDTLIWKKFNTVTKRIQQIYRIIDKKQNYMKSYCFDFFNTGKEQMLILMKNGPKTQSYISYLDGRLLPTQFRNNFNSRFSPGFNYYFGTDGVTGLNKFYLTSSSNKIFRTSFSRAAKSLILEEIPLKSEAVWFAVKKLNALNYSLIYSGINKNYIGIERL